jgi:hypothetical protein
VYITSLQTAVPLAIEQASESDFTLSLKSLDRFLKASAENDLNVSLSAAIYDSGDDGRGIYQFLLAKKIDPVIALNPRHDFRSLPAQPSRSMPTAFRSPRPPRCDATARRLTAGSTSTAPSNSRLIKTVGPILYVRSDSDPRLYPPIARDSLHEHREDAHDLER